jgi:hypothetical protein
VNFSRLHTEIVLLASGYIEVVCFDYDRPQMHRHWAIRRTVDYRNVCWG